MKTIKAIIVEHKDTIPVKKNSRRRVLNQESYMAALTADVVLYEGKLIKNRFGEIHDCPVSMIAREVC